MRVIGLSGKAGHGKDTVAQVLLSLYEDYGLQRRALADALKEDIADLLLQQDSGWGLQVWQAVGQVDRLAFINAIKHEPEIRSLLQAYGVAQRKARPDFWIQRLFTWAEEQEVKALVVPDVRFTNEADAIRSKGGLVVRVVRPFYNNGLTAEQRAHSSETELDNYPYFAFTLFNDGALSRLRQQVRGNALEMYVRRRGNG